MFLVWTNAVINRIPATSPTTAAITSQSLGPFIRSYGTWEHSAIFVVAKQDVGSPFTETVSACHVGGSAFAASHVDAAWVWQKADASPRDVKSTILVPKIVRTTSAVTMITIAATMIQSVWVTPRIEMLLS